MEQHCVVRPRRDENERHAQFGQVKQSRAAKIRKSTLIDTNSLPGDEAAVSTYSKWAKSISLIGKTCHASNQNLISVSKVHK